jgi:hypothetical protein
VVYATAVFWIMGEISESKLIVRRKVARLVVPPRPHLARYSALPARGHLLDEHEPKLVGSS